MRMVMAVPTYWSRPASEGWRKGDLVFDHPTPLDGRDTLGLLLESISILAVRNFELAVVVVPTTTSIEEEAVTRVQEIIRAAGVLVPTHLLIPSLLARSGAKLGDRAERFAPFLSLSGYPHVRNGCLLAARVLEAEVVVLIDDDEIFEDPLFFSKVREGFEQDFEDRKVQSLAGYYINSDGDFRLRKSMPEWGTRWPKYEVMDKAFEAFIGRPPRYKETPFAFGGNLSLHRDLYTMLPFDTNVTRGEDLDYLMMSLMHGIPTLLDNELSIRHEAPPKGHPEWQQFRQDVVRFAYQRSKLNADLPKGLRSLSPEDLDPYPGFFLREDLDELIAETSRSLAEYYRGIGDRAGAAESLRNIELGRKAGRRGSNAIEFFLDLKARWQEFMELFADVAFRDLLVKV